MFKVFKKTLIASLSILGVSTIVWIVLLTNPVLSYANQTQIDQVTVYHNNELDQETKAIVKNAINLIKSSDIYDDKLNIHLCLNDDKIYPHLHPIPGGAAYAFLNKTVVFASEPNFKNNTSEMQWKINNYELRKFNLTALLAHEFMHNLQHNYDALYYSKNSFGAINWKFEGHADYIARDFKNDGQLKEKIKFYLLEEAKEHLGVPVFILDDGTIQNLSYFKYALVVQYLSEVREMSYPEICNLDPGIEKPYSEMIEWSMK